MMMFMTSTDTTTNESFNLNNGYLSAQLTHQ